MATVAEEITECQESMHDALGTFKKIAFSTSVFAIFVVVIYLNPK